MVATTTEMRTSPIDSTYRSCALSRHAAANAARPAKMNAIAATARMVSSSMHVLFCLDLCGVWARRVDEVREALVYLAPPNVPAKVEPETEKEDTDDAHIDNEEPVVSDESVTEPKVEIPSQDDKVSAAQQELHEVATAIAQLDEDEEPVIALDLKFEAEPAKDVIVDDLQLEFDKAVAEDKLNPSEQDSPND